MIQILSCYKAILIGAQHRYHLNCNITTVILDKTDKKGN